MDCYNAQVLLQGCTFSRFYSQNTPDVLPSSARFPRSPLWVQVKLLFEGWVCSVSFTHTCLLPHLTTITTASHERRKHEETLELVGFFRFWMHFCHCSFGKETGKKISNEIIVFPHRISNNCSSKKKWNLYLFSLQVNYFSWPRKIYLSSHLLCQHHQSSCDNRYHNGQPKFDFDSKKSERSLFYCVFSHFVLS